MEVRSFPALLSAAIQIKKPCEPKFNLDCLLMEVAGANAFWRTVAVCQDRGRGSRREEGMVQLFSLGHK